MNQHKLTGFKNGLEIWTQACQILPTNLNFSIGMKFYINMEWNKIYYAGECNLVDVPTVVNVKCLHQMASNRDITLNEKCWQIPTFRQFLSSSQTTVILMLEGVAGEME